MQNKNFCINLKHKCYRDILLNSEHDYLFFYYLLHMKMKKTLLGAFLGIFAVAGIAVLPSVTSATEPDPSTFESGEPSTFGESKSLWYSHQDLQYNPDVYGKTAFQKDSLIHTIQKAINWVLGILSLIALALCLWGGFQMMTSGGDSKKYESGINLLKWAGIGLAVIALSWLVVSLIFYVINTAQVTPEQGAAGTTWGSWND